MTALQVSEHRDTNTHMHTVHRDITETYRQIYYYCTPNNTIVKLACKGEKTKELATECKERKDIVFVQTLCPV